MVEIKLPNMRRNKEVMLFQSGHRLDPSGVCQLCETGDNKATDDSVILWINGICFPGLGGAVISSSIDEVHVAVKRLVCRSFGRTLNR
jgi:hypothetical protein